jgi:hypothetical protein
MRKLMGQSESSAGGVARRVNLYDQIVARRKDTTIKRELLFNDRRNT